MPSKAKIFISYSHKDAEWLENLMPFLKPLVRGEEMKIWSDKEIKPSSDWLFEIKKALFEADAAILLVSQDFLASDFIAINEVPQLLTAASERGLRIFPVFVSSSYLKDSPLLQFQGVNSPTLPLDMVEKAKQNEIFTTLAKNIDELLIMAAEGVTEEWLENFRSRFVPVTGNTFVMGDDKLNGELKALSQRMASVNSFRMGQYSVTQSEWIAIMDTRPWANKENVQYGNDTPAVCVTWGAVMKFIGKLNKADAKFAYRLPTETEWEFAARGGVEMQQNPRTKFCFGDDENLLLEYGWHDMNASLIGEHYAHPVGLKKANQLNLYDMHGNIWEWTSTGGRTERVVRGGGFNAEAKAASSAYRLELKVENQGEALGFRLVQEPR